MKAAQNDFYLEECEILNTQFYKDHFQSFSINAVCPICHFIIQDPYFCSKCQCNFCKKCIFEWMSINNSNSSLKESDCVYKCKDSTINQNRILSQLLEKLKFKCRKCLKEIEYLTAKDHYLNQCSKNEDKKKEMEKLEIANQILRCKENTHKQTIKELKQKLTNLEEENKENENKNQKLSKDNKEMSLKLNGLQKENSSLKKEINSLTEENKNFRRLKNSLEESNSRLKTENISLKKSGAHLTLNDFFKSDTLEGKVAFLENQQKRLIEEKKEISLKLEKTKESLKEKMNEDKKYLEEVLEELKILFNEAKEEENQKNMEIIGKRIISLREKIKENTLEENDSELGEGDTFIGRKRKDEGRLEEIIEDMKEDNISEEEELNESEESVEEEDN